MNFSLVMIVGRVYGRGANIKKKSPTLAKNNNWMFVKTSDDQVQVEDQRNLDHL